MGWLGWVAGWLGEWGVDGWVVGGGFFFQASANLSFFPSNFTKYVKTKPCSRKSEVRTLVISAENTETCGKYLAIPVQ